ncbi:flagellar hook-associated family protein [Chthonobacter rhizosphaerae]|uniref:flagellar hook-associated family protein n=1 Tax=Chthonobacter rhizosphaerae TaxID=2735553 RepID=UPI0015EF9778|nr:flagellar hook-associated family protein [Chthonobacter rhizosphaerae]
MTTSVSNRSMSEATRLAIAQQTRALNELKSEQTTGRKADTGLSLGNDTGEAVSLRQVAKELDARKTTNAVVTTRLGVVQASLKTALDTAASLRSDLIALRDGRSMAALGPKAQSSLAELATSLNQSFDGQYLFGGINTGEAPFSSYKGTGTTPESAVLAAFTTAFPGGPGGTAARSATAAAMTAFLDGPHAALFDDPAWANTWSRASDTAPTARIADGLVVPTSMSANDQAFRDLAEGYAMIASFDVTTLSKEAATVLIDKALQKVDAGMERLTQRMGDLGRAEQQLKRVETELTLRDQITERRLADLEGVDPYETAAKLSATQTQLEAAYQITARLKNLSLLSFLR